MIRAFVILLVLMIGTAQLLAANGWTITGPIGASSGPPPVGCTPNGQLDFSNDGCGIIYVPALIH